MNTVRYRTIDVDGLNVFYREAGNPPSPKVVLLHGFPSSSHMFRDLIPRLAERFHMIAPDLRAYAPDFLGFSMLFDVEWGRCCTAYYATIGAQYS